MLMTLDPRILFQKQQRIHNHCEDSKIAPKEELVDLNNNETVDQYKIDTSEDIKSPVEVTKIVKVAKIAGGRRKGKTVYPCSHCDKVFTRRLSRTYHEAVHTGETFHKCQFCDKSFIQPSSKTKHEMSHFGLTKSQSALTFLQQISKSGWGFVK